MFASPLKLLSLRPLVTFSCQLGFFVLSCWTYSNWLKHNRELLANVTENPEVSAGLRWGLIQCLEWFTRTWTLSISLLCLPWFGFILKAPQCQLFTFPPPAPDSPPHGSVCKPFQTSHLHVKPCRKDRESAFFSEAPAITSPHPIVPAGVPAHLRTNQLLWPRWGLTEDSQGPSLLLWVGSVHSDDMTRNGKRGPKAKLGCY